MGKRNFRRFESSCSGGRAASICFRSPLPRLGETENETSAVAGCSCGRLPGRPAVRQSNTWLYRENRFVSRTVHFGGRGRTLSFDQPSPETGSSGHPVPRSTPQPTSTFCSSFLASRSPRSDVAIMGDRTLHSPKKRGNLKQWASRKRCWLPSSLARKSPLGTIPGRRAAAGV